PRALAQGIDPPPSPKPEAVISQPHSVGFSSRKTFPPLPQTKPRRKWRHKFHDAFRGVKLGIRGHSSFFVHFFFTALAVTAGIVLGCNLVEWCLLVGCIGGVITAELFNSAIETLVRVFDEPTRQRCKPILAIAAGAALIASGTALVIGATVFLSRFVALMGH